MIPVRRLAENPIITPQMVPPSRPDFEVVCAFNAAVAEYRGEILLLLRVAERARAEKGVARVPVLDISRGKPRLKILEFDRSDKRVDFSDPRCIVAPSGFYLTTISHLRLARSRDGIRFSVEEKPALFPERDSEVFGIEDPRITRLGDTYSIAYKGVSPRGITTSLAVTKDFVSYERKGIIFCPENLDVCIFPEKIGGRYAALHRPVPRMMGQPNMWLAWSPDLLSWGDHRFVMGVRPGKWDSARIGAGAVPVKTDRGWLEIYHGATDRNVYCLGAALLDEEKPYLVLGRSPTPILKPSASYERMGFMPNVVFTCGAAADGDRLTIYYGCCDEGMAAAEVSIRQVLKSLRRS